MAHHRLGGAAVIPAFAMMVVGGSSSGGGGPTQDSLIASAMCAVSLLKLHSSATNAIRVRRLSDNAESDIGFSGSSLDSAALLSFAGAGDAHVVKFYDQSGNGKDLSATSSGLQPRVVASGSYLGAAMFNGLSQCLKVASLPFATPQAHIYLNGKIPNGTGVQVAIEMGSAFDATGGGGRLAIYNNEGNLYSDCANNGSGTNRAGYAAGTGTSVKRSFLLDRSLTGANEMKRWTSGSADTLTFVGPSGSPVEQTGDFASTDLYVGARAESSLWCGLELVSLVVFNLDSSANRSDIEGFI